jgi:hypothetical protein
MSQLASGPLRSSQAHTYRRRVSPIDRAQVVAFRVSSHNLTKRLGPRSLVKAAAACGIQETPLGTAALALSARVDGLTPSVLDRALVRDRTLVHVWSLRGAPHIVPAKDLPAFTTGALPVDRASFNVLLGGWAPAIAEAGLDPFDLMSRMRSATQALLDGSTRDVNEFRDELLRAVRALSRIKRPEEARHDMPEPLFRTVGVAGAACIVAGRGTAAVLGRIDQWLRREPPESDLGIARAELTRRFLHCYGPSTPQRFAEWTTRSIHDAKAAFELVSEELEEVTLGDSRAWLLAADRRKLDSPPRASGVRLLPVLDPFLQQRDRGMLLEDERARKRLWRPVRGPGAVLVDGEIVGIWRVRKSRSRLDVSVEPFGRLRRHVREQIIDEADRITAFRESDTARVGFSG